MGLITCSRFNVPSEQHRRFRELEHQLEPDVCNFGGLRIRDCERSAPTFRTYLVASIGLEYKVLANANLDIRTTHSLRESYLEEPRNCGKDCYNGNEACSGDEHCCSIFGCDPAKSCRISYDFTKSSISVVLPSDNSYLVNCVFRIKVKVHHELKK